MASIITRDSDNVLTGIFPTATLAAGALTSGHTQTDSIATIPTGVTPLLYKYESGAFAAVSNIDRSFISGVYIRGTGNVHSVRWQAQATTDGTGAAVSQDASLATLNWFSHAAAAMLHIEDTTSFNAAKKSAAKVAYLKLPALAKIWYRVMIGSSAKRASWKAFSTAESASVYVDWLTAAGNPRTVDGSSGIILTGASFPANFDPEAIT